MPRILSPWQKDVLTEQVNIGFGHAAHVLADLLGQRIHLEAPQTGVYRRAEVPAALALALSGEVAAVRQSFHGPMKGSAYLLLEHRHAAILMDLLFGGSGQVRRMNASDYEALTEVGNIVLNAFLGTMSNLLHLRFTLMLSKFDLKPLDDLFPADDDETYMVVIKTRFRIATSRIDGYLVLLLGGASLQILIQAIDNL
ncbi:MAG: hypothetical protein Fur0018_00060 [Anaerolineales bacterium]